MVTQHSKTPSISNHDLLCPIWKTSTCHCIWITKVRADERERIAQAIEAIPSMMAKRDAQDSMWDQVIWRSTAARIARDGGNNA